MSSPRVSSLGIVGSGIMAAGIAEVALVAGHRVIIRSRNAAGADAVAQRVNKGLNLRVARGKLDDTSRNDAARRLRTTISLEELSDCTIILESIVECLDEKLSLFAELDALAGHDTILATNTSTLSVGRLALSTRRPDRVCGIHFFNPAVSMPLVEIIKPVTATDDTIEKAMSLVISCGKKAVLVRDDAGFIVNALLFPYLNNAIKMLERGTASIDDIDTAMKGGCNFPMGPFELLDLVGLDTSLSIIRTLHSASGNPSDAPAESLVRLVESGHLGRKSGRGFRSHGPSTGAP